MRCEAMYVSIQDDVRFPPNFLVEMRAQKIETNERGSRSNEMRAFDE